jgi:hypothetical protein
MKWFMRRVPILWRVASVLMLVYIDIVSLLARRVLWENIVFSSVSLRVKESLK